MAWISTGTVSVTNGSAAVTGSGTSWAGTVQAGWAFIGPDGEVYEISEVGSATEITLAIAFNGSTASGQAYTIMPTLSLRNDLAESFQALRAAWDVVTATGQLLVEAADAAAVRTIAGLADAAVAATGDVTITRSAGSDGWFDSAAPFASVALSPARADAGYSVLVEVLSADDAAAVGDVTVYDRATNGFKVKFSGSTDNVAIRWRLIELV